MVHTYVCTILVKTEHSLLSTIQGVNSTHKLARLSSLRNAILEPQSPAYPSESEAKHAHFMLCQYIARLYLASDFK